MTDFDIDVAPGLVYDGLISFNENIYGEKLAIDVVAEKRCILLKQVNE